MEACEAICKLPSGLWVSAGPNEAWLELEGSMPQRKPPWKSGLCWCLCRATTTRGGANFYVCK